ncbi:MAG TPA: hypothetical protein VG225_07815 [Terracidiphilus sp.]|nr:hypothetical protein [Terracidiphilus sp.]
MRVLLVVAFAGLLALGEGCKKNTLDKAAFKSALNHYLSSRAQCLWTAPIKFPAQVDTSNDEQTRGFDALTDAGLLTRTPVEKKRFLIGSKQANDYDLSANGRTVWTVDPSQPGYGNFCYGRLEVTAVDGYVPAADDATQYSVNYHYGLTSLPSWANSAEMKTAFPQLNAATTPQAGSANLIRSNDGWLVQNAQPVPPAAVPMP